MAVARAWLYFDTLGTIETIDFTQQVSAVLEEPNRVREDAVAISGASTRQDYGAQFRVKLTCDKFTNAAQRIALANLEAHLKTGRHIGFAADADKSWCGYFKTLPKRADTSLVTGGNVWWTKGTGTITSGDVMAIESANPEGSHQLVTESGGTGSTGTLVTSDAVLRSPLQSPCWLRHELFFPALYLPADQARKALLTSDARMRWKFECELVFDLSVMTNLERFDGGLLNLDTSTIAAGGKPTLDQVISEYTMRDVTDTIATNAAKALSRRFS
jgi:hypothetical protein